MKIEVLADAESAAKAAAAFIAAEARAAVGSRGRFLIAVSGGRSPWLMLRALAGQDMPWPQVTIFQVDERVAPAGHPDRNLTHIQESLANSPLKQEQIVAMPVETSDLAVAAAEYAQTLEKLAGMPPVLDLVHLGLGPDGHTASLVPGDPVLDVTDREVSTAGPYQKRMRMTLTYPLIDRARGILWLATDGEKAEMLGRLLRADATIPAGRVSQNRAIVFADAAAAGKLTPS